MPQLPELRGEPWGGIPEGDVLHRPSVHLAEVGDIPVGIRSCAHTACRTFLRPLEGTTLWELPLLEVDLQICNELELVTAGRVLRHAVQGLGTRRQGGILGASTSLDYEKTWDALLAHHVEHICQWSESRSDRPNATHAEGLTQVEWSAFLADYWNLSATDEEPPRHLIVQIAQACGKWVEDLCSRPRRILRRVRKPTPLAQAQDIDEACIRWLIRQPGRHVAERAGPRQRILAVTREESIDTPENRVLRDFLRLADKAASRYDAQYASFVESRRLREVRQFRAGIRSLLTHSAISQVPPLAGAPQRNYVLQFDDRYARLWLWYDRLRRQENDRDQLGAWRHRTWSEYCELLMTRACESLKRGPGSFAGPAVLRHEADHGRFLDHRTSPGPWSLVGGRPQELLRLVRGRDLSDHRSEPVRKLAALAPDLALTLGPVFAEDSVRLLLGVWTMFTPDDSSTDAAARADRLEQAMNAGGLRRTAGLLLLPQGTAAADIQQSPGSSVTCLRAGLPTPAALESTSHLLQRILTALVSGRSA